MCIQTFFKDDLQSTSSFSVHRIVCWWATKMYVCTHHMRKHSKASNFSTIRFVFWDQCVYPRHLKPVRPANRRARAESMTRCNNILEKKSDSQEKNSILYTLHLQSRHFYTTGSYVNGCPVCSIVTRNSFSRCFPFTDALCRTEKEIGRALLFNEGILMCISYILKLLPIQKIYYIS